MTLAAKTVLPKGTVNTGGTLYNTTLTEEAHARIESLTESLFFRKNRLDSTSVLMVDLGGNTSSLWLATGVASALGKAVHQLVHVLAVGPRITEAVESPKECQLDPNAGGCLLEYILDPATTAAGMNALTSRLSAIKANGNMAIVHLSQSKEQATSIPRADFVDGVVLIVRAARTRRAVLETIERQLAKSGTTLLGSVLLDRDYPIPEMIYRLI